MTSSRSRIISYSFLLAPLLLALLIIILALMTPSSARAFPEYARRTNEPCATCHVSPGGGGPRTMRGLLWIADGRPDKVRAAEGLLLAPGVVDPQVLYDIACAACHGSKGEGASAPALLGFNFSEGLIHRRIVDGAPKFGMPSFDGQFTEQQLAVLSRYVSDLSAGRFVPPESYPLPTGTPSGGSGDDQPGYKGN
jgi:cbb3-type cytochrome c oxidase subunit III